MKVSSLTFVYASLVNAGLVLAKVPLSSVDPAISSRVVVNKYIIEVENVGQIPGKRSIVSPHEALYAELNKRDVDFSVDREYKAEGLFLGAAVTLSNSSDIKDLEQTVGVVAVRPIVKFEGPKPVKKHIISGPDDSEIPADTESTHVMTGVDKVHAEGVTGSGVKIGIIDTGIDYTHPALGGAIGPGNKVIGGFDFVGDDYTGSNDPVPDDDPLDQCNGHGTHVAGIIGADPDNTFGISGVAYGASLTSYRVFGCDGFVTDDVLVEALLRGVSDGQNILTLSLGGPDGWTESTTSVLSSRIAQSGKVVTIAAGNEGEFGAWYTSSPGNGIDVISVGSVENTVISLQNATVNGVSHDPIPYFETFPFNVTEALPIYATSTDTSIVDDACDPLPDSTPDLSGFLTIIRRGTCTFVTKLQNAAAKGAVWVFIYDNGGGFAAIDTGDFTTATLIQAEDGQFLVEQFIANASITISFPQTGGNFDFPSEDGGLMSTFSTYGPTNDVFFKPAVSAPGGNILSTFPVPLGSFAVLSGTSMATPFVAGSSALLFEAKGLTSDVARAARTLFETTANRVPSSRTDGDPWQSVTQQGAGLIDVFDALHSTIVVSPGELLLNDTTHFQGNQKFTITNTGDSVKEFNISHIPAGTASTIASGGIFPNDGPVPLTADAASIKFSHNKITINPKQTVVVSVSISPPKGLDSSTYPVFSGFITISNGAESYHVTYLGIAASLRDKQVLDTTDEFFGVDLPVLLDSQGNIQDGPVNYTFVGDDVPTLLTRFVFGTPLFEIDLARAEAETASEAKSLGSLAAFQYIPRNTDASSADDGGWNTDPLLEPIFANGTTIPDGSYRFLLKALRVTGDERKSEDFESWLSPIFGVFP